ncbi:MAG: DUF2007 domain-containing protein [Armatimonadota bacterium]
MPFCPKCRYEYVEGIRKCPDCDVALVDALLEEPQKPKESEKPAELVTVASFVYPVEAEMAKLKLENEGIQSVLSNEVLMRTYGPILQDYLIKLQVREEDAKRALNVLESSHK